MQVDTMNHVHVPEPPPEACEVCGVPIVRYSQADGFADFECGSEIRWDGEAWTLQARCSHAKEKQP